MKLVYVLFLNGLQFFFSNFRYKHYVLSDSLWFVVFHFLSFRFYVLADFKLY